MNSNLHISLNKRWMGNLLGLLIILSMMLSTMAAAPMAPTPPTDTPAAPAVTTATPDAATATQPASPTDTQAAPAATSTAPSATETSPAVTVTAPAATSTAPSATETAPAVTETAPAPAETTSPTVQPTPTTPAPTKPAEVKNPAEASRVNYHKIVVKFKTSAQPQVGSQSTSPATSAAILKGLNVKPLFPTASSKSQLGAQSAAPVTNLSGYSIVQLPADTSYEAALQILQGLQSSDDVQLAYMEPVYRPADAATQPYLDSLANTSGIDAVYGNSIAGGKGENVRVTDVEGGWQIGHEDLPITNSSLIAGSNSSDPNWLSHGTAVLGIIAGQGVDNSNISPSVIDGIAPSAEMHLVSALSLDTATAIFDAAQNSRPGDIIIIPMEAQGPVSGDTPPVGCDPTHFEDIPVEYWQANYDAIKAATDLGIIVIEAAGDGSMNLDDTITPTHPKAIYNNAFKRSNRDSGAIIVGAGESGLDSTPLSPMCFSNFGSRVDVQGWGENIATTGGDADLYNGDPNQTYTDDFGGTSGAAAMVAGAVAVLQGIDKNISDTPISPSDMRKTLVKTGAPQAGDAVKNHIGPLVNLKNAIDQRSTLSLLAPPNSTSQTITTLRPTLDWSDYQPATSFDLQVDDTGTSFNSKVVDLSTSSSEYTLGFDLKSGHQYWWHVRATITTTTIDPITQNHITTTTHTDWTPAWTFKIATQAAAAVAPALQSPSNKSTSSDFNPLLTWKDPTSASTANLLEYKVEISTSFIFAASDSSLGIDTQSFTAPYTNGATPSTTSTNPPNPLNVESTYYWHVATCYGSNPATEFCSPWSGRWIIYTGLPAPDGLSEVSIPELRPTFSWNAVDGATAYFIQVAQQNQITLAYHVLTSATISLPKGQTVVPSTYTLTKDLPKNMANLDFRVAVKGQTVWNYSDYSGALFTTGTPPAVVSLISPKSKAVDFTFTPEFSWKPTKNWATDTYNIQISNTSDFEATDVTKNISTITDTVGPASGLNVPLTHTFAAALNPQTIYYWHVQSFDGSTYSDWSSTWVVYTAVPAPVNLTVPTDGNGYVDSLRPTFSWDPIDLADSYQIEVATDATYKHIVANVITKSGPPFLLPVNLPALKTSTAPLSWQIRAHGLYGWSDWTDGGTFSTPSNPPSLVSPQNGSIRANFNPTLTWNKLPTFTFSLTNSNYLMNPAGYDVQIATSPNFDPASLVFDSTTSGSPATFNASFPIVGSVLPDADQYYWRVRAENTTEDAVSAWSQPNSFFTPAIVSGTVMDLAGNPIAGATVQIGGKTLSATTDGTGKYQFFGLAGGTTYRLYASAFGTAPNGYIRQAYNVTTSNGQDSTLNFNLATVPAAGTMKIVLTWESAPNNLEANLWTPASNKFLVNEETTGGLGADPHARMDTPGGNPVTLGFGPEVISLDEVPDPTNTSSYRYKMAYASGIYTYAVHINSTPGTFGQANAVVTVYDGPNITFMKVFNVPTGSGDRWWKVFTISGSSRKITTLNQVINFNPQPYIVP